MNEKNRIVIIGCENVLAIDAYSLAVSSGVDELALLGAGNRNLARQVRGIIAERNTPAARVFAGRPSHAAEAKVAVIAAGSESSQTKNAEAIRRSVRKVVDAGFGGILLITTNPIEVMAHIARDESGFPSERVIGLPAPATPRDGSSSVATWCSGADGKVAFVDDCDPNCHYFETIAKGANGETDTLYGMATCVKRVCEPIIRRQPSILPLSATTDGEYGIENVYVALRCLVGRDGIEKVLEPAVSDVEMSALHTQARQARAINEQKERSAATTTRRRDRGQ